MAPCRQVSKIVVVVSCSDLSFWHLAMSSAVFEL